MNAPKVKQKVYIAVPNPRGFDIAKGIVSGCVEQSSALGQFVFRVDTPLGSYFRYPCEMWESVEDFQKDVPQFVIE